MASRFRVIQNPAQLFKLKESLNFQPDQRTVLPISKGKVTTVLKRLEINEEIKGVKKQWSIDQLTTLLEYSQEKKKTTLEIFYQQREYLSPLKKAAQPSFQISCLTICCVVGIVLSSFRDYYRTRTTSSGIKQVVQKELAMKELIMTVEEIMYKGQRINFEFQKSSLNDERISKTLILAEKVFSYQDLFFTEIRLAHPYKQLIYDFAVDPQVIDLTQNLSYTRYIGFPFPIQFPLNENKVKLELKQDIYSYKPESDLKKNVEWFVNFSDAHLFVAYSTGLFALDELQTAEHPVLCHLKEFVSSISVSEQKLQPYTIINGYTATPILIRNAERLVQIRISPDPSQNRPFGLYGNNFSNASQLGIQKALEKPKSPQFNNFICCSALPGGQGSYKIEEILYSLQALYTSFRAAIRESAAVLIERQKFNEKPFVIVHTGNWGAGSFGNNKILTALLQMIAAELAGVDKLIYHSFNEYGSKAFNEAKKLYEEFSLKSRHLNNVIKLIEQMKFEWCASDGN